MAKQSVAEVTVREQLKGLRLQWEEMEAKRNGLMFAIGALQDVLDTVESSRNNNTNGEED